MGAQPEMEPEKGGQQKTNGNLDDLLSQQVQISTDQEKQEIQKLREQNRLLKAEVERLRKSGTKAKSPVFWTVVTAILIAVSSGAGLYLQSIPIISLVLNIAGTLAAIGLFVTGDDESISRKCAEGVVVVVTVHALIYLLLKMQS